MKRERIVWIVGVLYMLSIMFMIVGLVLQITHKEWSNPALLSWILASGLQSFSRLVHYKKD